LAKNICVASLFQQLIAARLQHLLTKPRDGLTPPRVIFYKTRFAAAFNSFSNARASFLLVCSSFLYRMAVPGKTTALGGAPGFKADYHQLCLFYFQNHYTVVLLSNFLTHPLNFENNTATVESAGDW
jgi:hypothetical protein